MKDKNHSSKLNVKTISFVSGKGGTGKTSIVANLGVHLASEGFKVLLVDMDFFTRGLTFYIAKGKLSFEGSVIDILRGSQSLLPTQIGQDLFLIPSTSKSLDLVTLSDLPLEEQESRLSSVLSGSRDSFDFILVDQRSGIDPITISTTLSCDGYIIVTEEDRTSQRASYLLLEALKRFKETSIKVKKGAAFLGFVINMYTTNYADDLIKFMETSVFDESCLAAIPLLAKVRKTFVKDEIMVIKFPSHDFSREVRALANTLLPNLYTSSSIERVMRRRRMAMLFPTIAIATAIFFYIAFSMTIRRFDFAGLVLSILVSIMVFVWVFFWWKQRL